MRNGILFLAALIFVTSCDVTKNNKKRQALWTSIESPKPTADPLHEEKFFTLNPVFIDSLLNMQDSIVLPMPNISGEFDKYKFKEIFPGDQAQVEGVRGFLGQRTDKTGIIMTLYVDQGRLTGKWDMRTIKWLLRYSVSGDTKYYTLTDLKNKKNALPEAPIPLEEY